MLDKRLNMIPAKTRWLESRKSLGKAFVVALEPTKGFPVQQREEYHLSAGSCGVAPLAMRSYRKPDFRAQLTSSRLHARQAAPGLARSGNGYQIRQWPGWASSRGSVV